MKQDTHLLVGIGASFFILNPMKDLDILVVFLGSIIGSLLPDLDLRVKHRALLHNLPVIILVSLLAMLLEMCLAPRSNTVFISMYKYFTISIILSWILHIVVDMVNPSGVSIIWPLKRTRFKLFRQGVKHDSMLGNISLKIIGMTLLFLYAYKLVA